MPEPELFHAPDDLSLVSDADLAALQDQAVAEFDRIEQAGEFTAEALTYSATITESLDRIRAELQVREDRASRKAETERLAAERRMQDLRGRVHGDGTGEGGETATAAAAAGPGGQINLGELTQATAQGVAMALFGENSPQMEQVKSRMASLSATRNQAPPLKVPGAVPAITASVDIPGVATGQALPTIEALGSAFQQKARAIPITRDGRGAARHLVASVRNTFEHTIDERTNPATVEELWKSILQGKSSNLDALVAGGGWCAPSEIMYNFFNIAEADGMVDLPSVGVSRGGIRFPVSPAIGDVFFQASVGGGATAASGLGGFAFPMSNATDPWLWTESDDILTVTGSVNKPTLRVPCPTFSEVRLECYGLSLTAGNLTDDAYPESTQNFIRLMRAAYAHAINARLISLMDTAAGGANTIGAVATDGPAPRIYNSVALAATDYRARFAMSTNAVLEVIMPYYIREVIRADLALKQGVSNQQAVSDAEIDSFFSARNVRVQWVNDYQVRGASQPGNSTVQLVWPGTVNFLMYAAGTFLHGTGLQLDLGVIRDSVLNAENDYTALWAEECHLIALVGHAARKYTVAFNVSGQAGGAVATPNGAHV